VNERTHKEFWELDSETEIVFSVDGEGDPNCEVCSRHPQRHERKYKRDRFPPTVCDLVKTEVTDRQILKRLKSVLEKHADPITVGDLRATFEADVNDGFCLGLEILGVEVPKRG